MRPTLLALALCVVACRGSGPSGPAWPRSAGVEADADEDDGGESLAPHQSAHPATALERAEDPTAWEPDAADDDDDDGEPAPAATTDPDPVIAPAPPDDDDLEVIEVIEVGDDDD